MIDLSTVDVSGDQAALTIPGDVLSVHIGDIPAILMVTTGNFKVRTW